MRPQKSGLYWAKNHRAGWFSLLVYVEGEAPFLKARVLYDFAHNQAVGPIDPAAIVEWGEKMTIPEKGPKL